MTDAQPTINLSKDNRFHVLGAASSGTAQIVEVLLDMGQSVSATRVTADSEAAMEHLVGKGLRVLEHTDLGDADFLLFWSPSVLRHPLVARAEQLGRPVVGRGPVVNAIAERHRLVVGVAGTSGKTTTSAMTAAVMGASAPVSTLITATFGPSNFGGNFGGHTLVVEAHEDDQVSESVRWDALVLTNVDTDHAEWVGGISGLHDIFRRSLQKAQGLRLVCSDDATALEIAQSAGVAFQTYGINSGADWRVENLRLSPTATTFDLSHRGSVVQTGVFVPMPGRTSALNAAAAMIVGQSFGISTEKSAGRLIAFRAPDGRWQRRGQHNDRQLIYDFANLPGELASSVATAVVGRQQGEWRRVVAVLSAGNPSVNAQWYERLDDIAAAVAPADLVVVTGSTFAGEPSAIAGNLRASVERQSNGQAVFVDREQLASALSEEVLQPGDLCLVTGALLRTLPDELRTEWGLQVPEQGLGRP